MGALATLYNLYLLDENQKLLLDLYRICNLMYTIFHSQQRMLYLLRNATSPLLAFLTTVLKRLLKLKVKKKHLFFYLPVVSESVPHAVSTNVCTSL